MKGGGKRVYWYVHSRIHTESDCNFGTRLQGIHEGPQSKMHDFRGGGNMVLYTASCLSWVMNLIKEVSV